MSHRKKAKATLPYVALLVAAILLCLAGALALTVSVRNGKSDATRFEELSAECNKQYNDDLAKGVRYTLYPCDDGIIADRFKKIYGYEYKL